MRFAPKAIICIFSVVTKAFLFALSFRKHNMIIISGYTSLHTFIYRFFLKLQNISKRFTFYRVLNFVTRLDRITGNKLFLFKIKIAKGSLPLSVIFRAVWLALYCCVKTTPSPTGWVLFLSTVCIHDKSISHTSPRIP